MLERLRRLPQGLGLSWVDLLLALVFVAAAVAWAFNVAQPQTVGPFGTMVDKSVPEAPLPPFVKIATEQPHPDPAILINVIAAVPLAFRRRLPYLAFAVSLGGVLVLRDGLTWPGFLAILITAYSAVAYGRHLPAGLAMLTVGAALAASEFSNSIPDMPGWVGPFVILLPIGLAAAAIRNLRARADAAARRATALEQEQAATARAAIAEERARIARELHDVVSHHVSVMVIQAGAAGKVIGQRPDLAANALTAIEASGREAMSELRQLLGLVTPAQERLHPQPGLADLAALIDTVRAAGQPVTLRQNGGELSPGVDLTAYRVVQEGLTNALRYAPGAPTVVEIRRDGVDLVIEVRNEESAVPVDGRVGAGSGLVGLAERLRLHHGSLAAGPRLSGGYRLVARLPLVATIEVT